MADHSFPLSPDQISSFISDIPDEVLSHLQFSVPWQYDPDGFDTPIDSDGFFDGAVDKDDPNSVRSYLQSLCWNKFQVSPQINTSVRGLMGRLTGEGFGASSGVFQINEEIQNTEVDPRNRLYNFWPKYVARSNIEGELFLILTIHENGFVEVDFMDPTDVNWGGDEGSGIIFHQEKQTLPLFYNRQLSNGVKDQIPSIYIAHYPEMANYAAARCKDYNRSYQVEHRSRKKIFNVFGGYRRFVVAWDKGFMTRRAVSYLRTTLEWLNHYETLKKYEIDHKKSSGAYLWTFTFTDVKAYKIWLSLSDADKRKTALMQPIVPGSRLILPPGVTVEAKNPQLGTINEQDTDILQMVASGLNEPEDVMMSSAKGTFATVKAGRGPMTDRISDEIAYFRRFLIWDFWRSVFFLKSSIGKFPKTFPRREAVYFKEGKPIFKIVPRTVPELIKISFPISQVLDFAERAKGLLGTKHGPLSGQLGIPNETVAELLGIGSYERQRLVKATEDENYPELIYEAGVDAESKQEKDEGEPGKKKAPKKEAKKPAKVKE